jgi:hypothetical protein
MFIDFIEIKTPKRGGRPNSSVRSERRKKMWDRKNIIHKSGDMVKREKRSLKSVERSPKFVETSPLIPTSIRQKSTFARLAYKKHDNR